MTLSPRMIDELMMNARRLKDSECQITCTHCGTALVYSERPVDCPECAVTNHVFVSCFDACDTISQLRASGSVLVAPTSYVPNLGWLVGYYFSRRTLRVA